MYPGWVAFNGFLTVLAVVAALLYPHYFEGEKLVITLGYAYLLAGTPDALLDMPLGHTSLSGSTRHTICAFIGMGQRVGKSKWCAHSVLFACCVRWVDVHLVAAGDQEVSGTRARGRPHLLQGQDNLSHTNTKKRGLMLLSVG